MIKTVEWTNEGVRMLDQRLLPNEEKYLMLRSYEEVADAIKKMVVRGAPAIGISAAMGWRFEPANRRGRRWPSRNMNSTSARRFRQRRCRPRGRWSGASNPRPAP